MIDFKVAVRTTLLLVDGDLDQLYSRALGLKSCGFSVITAASPVEAISIMKQSSFRSIDIAVIDYHMPVVNGCILAEYLKTRCPELKIVLYSGALDIPEQEMSTIDVFVPKADGVAALLGRIAELRQTDPASSTIVSAENNAFTYAVN